jgi:putative ribosome biogenesis GTPase RsgA
MLDKMNSVYQYTDRDLEDLEYECKKFRICIIGRTGVGKSTLLARVFGFNDVEVRETICCRACRG